MQHAPLDSRILPSGYSDIHSRKWNQLCLQQKQQVKVISSRITLPFAGCIQGYHVSNYQACELHLPSGTPRYKSVTATPIITFSICILLVHLISNYTRPLGTDPQVSIQHI